MIQLLSDLRKRRSQIDKEFHCAFSVPSLSRLWCSDLCLVYHGTNGPVIVDDMARTLLADKFVLAGQELGFDHVDVTAQKQFGKYANKPRALAGTVLGHHIFYAHTHVGSTKHYSVGPVYMQDNVQYNTEPIYSAPISPSTKPKSEAREATATGSDQHMWWRKVCI